MPGTTEIIIFDSVSMRCSNVICLLPILPVDVGFNWKVFALLYCYIAYAGSCLPTFWGPKMSVNNYQHFLCNAPEVQKPHLHCGNSLKSSIVFILWK